MKLLYDLVYNKENENETAVGIDGGDVTAEDGPRHRIAGMAVDVKRGSSLDVGVLIDVEARQRCSIECWYHPPDIIQDEIVLMRRSQNTDDLHDLSPFCCASENDWTLWELVLLPTGQLQFRTSGGSSITTGEDDDSNKGDDSGHNRQRESSGNISDDDESNSKNTPEKTGYCRMNRWNHVCLVLNSRLQGTLEDCSVMVLMKGVDVASSLVTINVHDIVSPGATDATTSIANSKNQSRINTVEI